MGLDDPLEFAAIKRLAQFSGVAGRFPALSRKDYLLGNILGNGTASRGGKRSPVSNAHWLRSSLDA
jgi:hypothetical protein